VHTTDGFKAYKWATALAFPEGSVDYGVADHVWTIAELVALLPEQAGRFKKIGAAAE